jgi:cyclophilin family peptidyl-prolyl cis-trans isomerase
MMERLSKWTLLGGGLLVTAALVACGSPAETVTPVFREQEELVAEYPPPSEIMIDPAKTYTATIVTEKGDINLNLFADKVPATVNSFVYLACEGFYDNTTFHRVIPGFMTQGGDPTGTGGGGPGYRFGDEFHPDLRHDSAGTLSMANAGPDTNGSQFFITHAPTPHLDGWHAVFGKVADQASMDVVLSIRERDPVTDTKPGDVVITILIQEDGQAFCST